MPIRNRSAEHLVIGGGLAGSTMGIRLAAAGRRVTLLERELKAHHKVCGEFLSHEAVAESLGLTVYRVRQKWTYAQAWLRDDLKR